MRRRAILASGSTLLAGLASQSAGAQTAGGPRPPYYNVLDFGAAGDGRTLNTAAFDHALKTCAEAGGGAIYVPPGEHLSGPILLRSNTVLHLAAGASLQDYPAEPQQVSGESARAGLVTARGAENVAILGRGAIDGNSMPFHSERINLRTAGAAHLERGSGYYGSTCAKSKRSLGFTGRVSCKSQEIYRQRRMPVSTPSRARSM